jgi:hypothetical protein
MFFVMAVALGVSSLGNAAETHASVAPTPDREIVRAGFTRALPLTDARASFAFRGRGVGSPRVDGRVLALDGNAAPKIATPERTPAIVPGVPVGQPLVDDPGRPGPYAVATGRYERADVAVGLRPRSEVVGDVLYPVGAPGARPLVLILHGRHATCYRGKDETGGWPCRPGFRPFPSENGYRDMARVLASQGNVVVSIAANAIAAADSVDLLGGGTDARAALVDHHLRLWAAWATAGGAPFADMTGRVDPQRTILVGHSRGGEGVVRAATTRAIGAPWRVRGLALLAPTAFAYQPVLGIPTAVLLPTCDGDVNDLQGQLYIDRGRDVAPGDTALRSTVLIVGGNHNAFNSEWMPGTSAGRGVDDSACARRPNRIKAPTQRAVGTAYVAALVRVALDGNADSAALLDGSAVHAPSAGAATVYSSALGGARTRLFGTVRATALSATGVTERICRTPANPASARARPGCFRTGSPHYLPPPYDDKKLATAGIVANWTAPNRRLDIALPAPVVVGEASHLDLRVVVRRSSPDVGLDGALIDTTGREIPLVAPGDLRPIPGVSKALATNWAQTLRFAIPVGNATTAVAAVRVKTRSRRGAVVILDGHLRTAGLPAIAPITVPQIDVAPTRVREPRPGVRRSSPISLVIRGVVSTPARVRLAVFSPRARLVRTRVIDVPVGATTVPIPLRVAGDRAYNPAPIGPLVQIFAISGITTGRNSGQVEVVDDDPRPGVIVARRPIVVTEGDLVRIPLRLTRRVASSGLTTSGLALTPVPLARGGHSLSVDDVVEVGQPLSLPFERRGRALAETEFGALVLFSPTDLAKTVTFRIARDQRREGTERARFVITNDDPASRPILGKPLVVDLVVRDRR